MMKNKYDYVIFHRGCLDGFAGFFIFIKCLLIQLNQEFTYSNSLYSELPFIYSDHPDSDDIPPNIKDKNVLIIDVAYKRKTLEGIITIANHVTHIDHHVTIREDVIQLESIYKNKFISIYDVNESGASLTWIHFKKYLKHSKSVPSESTKIMPKFIRYIRDNDIGTWKLKNTMPFITALRVHYVVEPTLDNVRKWSKLFDKSEVRNLIMKGFKYQRYEDYLLDQNFRRYSLESFPSEKIYNEFQNDFTKPGQYRVAVINGSGCPSSSLLGKKIVEEIDCDFCIFWTLRMDKKEFILAFRSRKAHVGNIAKLFGGGGHEFASACSIPLEKYNIVDLFFPESLQRK